MAHHSHKLGVEAMNTQIDYGTLTGFGDPVFNILVVLATIFFNAGRGEYVRPARIWLQRKACDLSAYRSKPENNNGFRIIVLHNNFHACRGFPDARTDDLILMSSLSMLNTDTQFSIACSVAVRWMVSTTIFLSLVAESLACSRMSIMEFALAASVWASHKFALSLHRPWVSK